MYNSRSWSEWKLYVPRGIADEIIIEEYEGQKIDDIKRLDVDIFTVGSDWRGKFDYLNAYCKVVYLDRTQWRIEHGDHEASSKWCASDWWANRPYSTR